MPSEENNRFEPIVVQENFRENGELKSVLQYVDDNSTKKSKFYLLPFWLLVVSSILLLALLILFISAVTLAASKRSGLYKENCIRRSCMKGLNLKCINQTCSCLTNQYYLNGCFNKKNYLEIGCMGSASYYIDGKNLTCIDGACKCNKKSFWNGSSCYLKSLYGGICTTDNQCFFTETRVTCDLTRKKCLCNSDRAYDGNVCYPKRTINEKCNSAIFQCNENSSLLCQNGICQCSALNYWNGFSCVIKKSYSVACKSSSECNDAAGLICPSTSNTCNCPVTANTSFIFCDCTSGNYYDYIEKMCKPLKTLNNYCLGAYQCNQMSGLFCNKTTSQCSCPLDGQNWQWAATIGKCILCGLNEYNDGYKCVPQKTYGMSCSNLPGECYTAGSLSCLNGICDCPLPVSQKMVWNPYVLTCQILPSNCKEILGSNPNAASGIFYLSSPVGFLEAYCEMVINGGGYTFLPWNSLSQSTTMLQNIYNDTSQILFRIISRTNAADQPYIITTQLNSYINIPIAIKQNSYLQYTMPKNLAIGPYIYIGFLPASMVKITMAQGFSANGVQISFQNCDGNPHSYFALFANTNPTSSSGYSVPGGLIQKWIAASKSHPLGTYLPSKYFFFHETHQGGCGEYSQSNTWNSYFGTAFGIK